MIIQRVEDGLLAFRQTDHARLAGDIALAWGAEGLPAPPRRSQALVAAYRHDDGWAEWELAPRVNDKGEPVDFLRIRVPEHVELYRRGTDLVEAEDPFAGCVVSLHGKRLYTRPMQEGGEPRYKRMGGTELELAERYVEREVERERRLVQSLAGELGVEAAQVREELEETWRMLQVWDRLSLFVCLVPLGSGVRFDMPAIGAASGEDVRITISTPEPGRVELDPYPFSRDPVELAIEAIELDGDRWPDDAAFRAAFRSAPRRIVEIVTGRAS